MFRNVTEKESPKKSKRGVFSKKGVQIATRPSWAFQDVPLEGPYFPINRGRSEGEMGSALLVLRNHLKLVRKIVSLNKIQAETLP